MKHEVKLICLNNFLKTYQQLECLLKKYLYRFLKALML